MKAAVARRYGPPGVVRLVDLPDPVAGPGDVIVRVRSTTVSSGDARVRAFNVPAVFWLPGRLALGVLRPRRRVLGTEFAGVIETVGAGVTRFKAGDRVFGMASFTKPEGTHAELLRIAADGLVEPLPDGTGFDEAGCLCFGLLTARHFLQKEASLAAGERVLIVGASGAVGCASVQLAKHLGAHVTAVCRTRNVDLVRSLGADEVIDSSSEPFTELRDGWAGYNVVMDTVGATSPLSCRGVVAEGGRYIAVVMDARSIAEALWCTVTQSLRVIMGVASEEPADLAAFRSMLEAGAYRSVIDRTFELDRIVEAHEHVDGGRKRGNVVVRVSSD